MDVTLALPPGWRLPETSTLPVFLVQALAQPGGR